MIHLPIAEARRKILNAEDAAQAFLIPDAMLQPIARLRGYFGQSFGGADLRESIVRLPLVQIEWFRRALESQNAGARVVFMGNGGSFDNARLMAALCRAQGMTSKTPGHSDDYLMTALSTGYDEMFTTGLAQDSVGPGDLVVGISGSGNSASIVRALTYARKRGAAIFCLGGRDGGEMRGLCGDDHAIIVPSDCMEAIEDLHAIVLLLALAAIKNANALEVTRAQFLQCFDRFASDANLKQLAVIVQGLIETIIRDGHALVLGTGIGAHHFRADLMRGATNTIPIRGVSAPECFTMNSAQATANDDGLHFLLVDGLVKLRPNANDFAVLCETSPAERSILIHCRSVLESSGTAMAVIGPGGVDLSMFDSYSMDFAVAMLGHAAGVVIRESLQELWKIRLLEFIPIFPPGQKKMGERETLALEAELKTRKIIDKDEQLTFCYGRLYAAQRPNGWTGERCYF